MYLYRTSAVPGLLLGDPAQTFQFCECFLNTLYNHGASQKKSFFTDESWFYKTEYVNSQNN
jgi:hypothetical protein